MKKDRRCRSLWLGLSLIFLASLAAAYPIPPVTLWQLVSQADLIVVGRVAEIEHPRQADVEGTISRGDYLDPDVAVLEVVETWKGTPIRQVRVNFSSGLLCPAPPRYVLGQIVLAFLERGETQLRHFRESQAKYAAEAAARRAAALAAKDPNDKTPDEDAEKVIEPESDPAQADRERRWEEQLRGHWLTVGLSYGTLYPDSSDLRTYGELVREALRLQSAGPTTDSVRREWLLRAAERRATRWHGLYELMPRSDSLHFSYDRSGRESGQPGLSTRELYRIAGGFVREPSCDNTLPMVLEILADYSSRELDRAIVAVMDEILTRKSLPWWSAETMAAVFKRYGDPNARARVGLDEPDCEGLLGCARIDPPALAGVWQQARKQLGIPDVPPARIPAPRVYGVGGSTPD